MLDFVLLTESRLSTTPTWWTNKVKVAKSKASLARGVCALESSSSGSICVSCLSVHRVTDCSHRAITMLLILVEVHVEVACRSTTVKPQSHATYPVGENVACRSTTATNWTYKATSMLLILVEVSVKLVCQSTQLQTAATQTEGSELPPCYLF